MQRLSSSEKGWVAVVAAIWLIALAALIFILPKQHATSDAAPYTAENPAGSIEKFVERLDPSGNAEVAAQMVDMQYVYGTEPDSFVPVCEDDPDDLKDLKKGLAGRYQDRITFEDGESYILLLSPERTAMRLDVTGKKFDPCTQTVDQFVPTTGLLPIAWTGEKWAFSLGG